MPEMPISALLEDNPHLIGSVMSILDQLLPIDAKTPESGSEWLQMADSVPNEPEMQRLAPILPNDAQEVHFDTETGVWMTNDDETPENGSR
jgi:hypothetical protein